MIMTDKDGNIIEINQAQLDILGSPSSEATKQLNMITFPKLREAGIGQAYEKVLNDGQQQVIELPYKSKWGKEIYFRSKINPIFDDNGQVTGCISVIEDISDRVRAQNELEKSEQRFLQLFTTIKEAVDIVDRELKHTKRTPLSHKRALTEATEDTKLTQINDALLHTQGNIKKAAIYLGISRSALHRLISRYQIDKNKFK
jgi:PAS domain S-box-containing protein